MKVRRGGVPALRVITGMVCALLVCQPAAADQWYEHYQRAEEALQAEDWQTAIQELNRAIEKKGNSEFHARTYGMVFASYFPYFKLGIAYFHLGQLDAAEQALETEENLAAITRSADEHAELQRYRGRIEEARQAEARQQQERIQDIVAGSLARARELAASGRFDEAMNAVDRALAVDRGNSDALELKESVRQSMARELERSQLERRVAGLVELGRQRLEQGKYDEAASLFSQALDLEPSDELRAMWQQAQDRLREQLSAGEARTRRAQLITEGMARAVAMEQSSLFMDALVEVEAVLAVDPTNGEAASLKERLLDVQAGVSAEEARQEALSRLLEEAEAQFFANDFERVLATSNRVLALDAGNPAARDYLTRAYVFLNQHLLGVAARGNLPPAIRFADFRNAQLDDGLKVESLRRPQFRLSGAIFDDAVVEIAIEQLFSESGETARRDFGASHPVEAVTSSQPFGETHIHEFRVDRLLNPGLSVFRIVVMDKEGLSSSSDYAVIYQAPLYRSPWLYAVLLATTVVVASVLSARRVRRRNELLRRKFNPYIAGAPVRDASLFFGREKLVRRVLQTVHNNSLLLYGERRIGKTSLQHHIMQRLKALDDPDMEFYPVFIDLQGEPEDRFFATLAHDVFEQLGELVGDVQPSAPLDGSARYAYRDLVRDLRAVLRGLQEQSSKQVKLVLLIDEVDELNTYDPKTNQRFRSLFMKSFAENLVAVVSGVQIKKHWRSEGSPWYNFFEEIPVEPFTRDEAEKLITRPIRGFFKLEPGVVDRIVARSDCKPYLIQKLCVALVSRMHEEERRTITVADVDAIDQPGEA